MSRLGPVYTLAAGAILTVALGAATLKASPVVQQVGVQGDITAAPTETAPPVEATASASPEPVPADKAEPAPSEQADPTPKKADYAGVVQGNGGLIAISIRNGKVIAYFCDGRIESWLKGTAENNTITAEGKNSLLTASIAKGKAQGRIQFGKQSWRFVASVVKKPSGLYRATANVRGAKVVGGWIILPNGQEVGRLSIGAGNGEPAPRFVPGSDVEFYGIKLTPKATDDFINELN
jgi:hypothetical protein